LRVAEGEAERVGGVRGARSDGESEPGPDEAGDLGFRGASVAHDRALYLGGGILVDGEPRLGGREQDHPSGLPDAQGGAGVPADERGLERHLVGAVFQEEPSEPPVESAQAVARGRPARIDPESPRRDELRPPIRHVEDPVA
jgi:hypothetical protein